MNLLRHAFASFTAKEKKWFFFFIFLALASSIATAAITVEENSVLVPVSGGIYREGIVGQPVAINPLISNNPADNDISALIYPRLSDVVHAYSNEENGRVFVLNIKENITWDDEKPLTSDDVVFTIETIQELGNQSPFMKNVQGMVAERASELQVRISLPVPYSFFEESMKTVFVLPKHIFGNVPPQNIRLSSYNLEPVGGGPYKFKSFAQRKDGFISEYTLIRNENYFGEQAFIEKFVFKFFENEEKVLNALRLREIDGFGTSGIVETKTIASSQMKALPIAMSRYYALFFNLNTSETFKNASVRNALSGVIDREAIISSVFSENKAEGIANPLFEPKRSPDKTAEEASAILAKAKIVDARIIITAPKIEFLEKTAEEIKRQWENIDGIGSVSIQLIDPKKIVEKSIQTNNYEALLFGNVLENKEDLFPFWHSSQRMYPGLNLSFYKNEKVDLLIDTIRQTKDVSKRSLNLQNANAEIMKDAPAIFLYTIPYTYIHTAELGGILFEEENISISQPNERFREIQKWYMTKARVIKK